MNHRSISNEANSFNIPYIWLVLGMASFKERKKNHLSFQCGKLDCTIEKFDEKDQTELTNITWKKNAHQFN